MRRRWIAWGLAAVVLCASAATLTGLSLGEAAQEFGTGWTVQWFNNPTLSGTPVATETLSGGINFNWGGNPPNPAVPADNWSARFTSTQQFAAGLYQFVLTSDDGARFLLDGVTVIDQWANQTLTTGTANINLTQGTHFLEVQYFDGIDQASLQFQWFQIGGFATPTLFGGPTATVGPAPTATRIPPTALPQIPPGALTATVINASVLLARSQPFLGAPVVTRLLRGQTYQIIGRNADTTWFLLQLSGFQGWAWGYYLFTYGNPFNAPIVDPFTTSGPPASQTNVVMQTTAALRLRAAPNTDAPQTGRIPWGTILPLIGRTADGAWLQTQYLGTTGWIANGYGRIVQGDPAALPVTG